MLSTRFEGLDNTLRAFMWAEALYELTRPSTCKITFRLHNRIVILVFAYYCSLVARIFMCTSYFLSEGGLHS